MSKTLTQIVQELLARLSSFPRRLRAYFRGVGPYSLRPFRYFESLECSTAISGIDWPESCTGILLSEDGGFTSLRGAGAKESKPKQSQNTSVPARFKDFGIFPEPTRQLYSLNQGGLVGHSGLVYQQTKRLAVIESISRWQGSVWESPELYAPMLQPAIATPGIGLSLITLGAEGYYHFMHELLPKLIFARDFLPLVQTIFINKSSHWGPAWLEHLGVDLKKVEWIHGMSHFHCSQLLFCSQVVADCRPNLWSVHALRESFKVTATKNPERWIWASRADATSRKPAWEQEVLAAFPKFESVQFSKLKPQQVLDLCAETSVFAGPHGAAFSNTVFCPPGTKVIEILPEQEEKPLYQRLAEVNRLNHQSLEVSFSEEMSAKAVIAALENSLALGDGSSSVFEQ